jgi:hypothetical protein
LLDSEHANSIVGSQTDWLKDELKKRQTQLYRFAIYHVPAYPSVRSYFNRYSSLIRRYWVPLFEEGHIQYAFEHHDHSYKRTYPLLRNRRHPRGIVYFGDGAWGIEKPRQAFLKRPYLASSMPIQHILLVTLKPQQTSVEMISHNGKILDRWYTHFFKTGQNVDID